MECLVLISSRNMGEIVTTVGFITLSGIEVGRE